MTSRSRPAPEGPGAPRHGQLLRCRGWAAESPGHPGSVAIVAGYLAAILPHELGASPARQTAGIARARAVRLE